MLGIEPQKRNRTGGNKSKVAKSKKDQKLKKEEPSIKAESMAEALQFASQYDKCTASIKQELSQAGYPSQFTPTSLPSPSVVDCQPELHSRLMTPCSDDMLSATHTLGLNAGNNILCSTSAFDRGSCGHEHSQMNENSHGSWPHSPVYSNFDAAYDLDEYGLTCDHLQVDHSLADDCSGASGFVLAQAGAEDIDIKNEHWDAQYHG
jgi:hypothetical protein